MDLREEAKRLALEEGLLAARKLLDGLIEDWHEDNRATVSEWAAGLDDALMEIRYFGLVTSGRPYVYKHVDKSVPRDARKNRARVLEYLAMLDKEAWVPATVIEKATGVPMGKNSWELRSVLGKLIAEGLVQKLGEKRSRVYRLVQEKDAQEEP